MLIMGREGIDKRSLWAALQYCLCAPASHIELARIIHESAAPTVDMTVLPDVLGP